MKLIPIKEVIAEKISGEWGDEAIDGKGVVIIRTANFLNSGKINFSNLVRREVDQKKVARKRLISGDIIIEKSGGSPTQPVGRVVIFQSPDNDTYLCNNFTSILRPKKDEVHPEYLFYVLHNNHKKGKTLRYQNKTTGIINLKLDSYLDSEIPLPPLDDQIRIAHLLGKVEGLIAQRKQHLQQLDDLFKSVFLEMFGDPVRNERGWEMPALSAFGKISTGNTPPRNDPSNYDGAHIEWIKTDNITTDSVFIHAAVEHLSETGARRGRTVSRGALLVACIAGSVESIGRAALTDRTVAFNQQINAIQPAADVNPFYLYGLFKLSRAYIQSRATKGMKKILTKGDFEKITMIKPPLVLQNQFAAIVEKVEGIKASYQHSLAELEILYGALSQQAFKGELDLSRVPLPSTKPEEEKAVVTEPLQAHAEESLAINLPDTDNLLDALENAEAREALIAQWLEAYRGQLGNTPFSVQRFMAAAQTRLAELLPDNDFELGANDYQHIKTWVFEALEQGRLTQIYDDANNRIQLNAA